MYACIMNIINFYQSNNTKTVKKTANRHESLIKYTKH